MTLALREHTLARCGPGESPCWAPAQMLWALIIFLFLFLFLAPMGVGLAQTRLSFNVKDYGAVGDGVRLDTEAINQAVQACAAAGGGTVFFPAGTYRTGTIHLKSDVTLWVDSGATVLGSKDPSHYQWPQEERSWYY